MPPSNPGSIQERVVRAAEAVLERSGSWNLVEKGQPLCLACADLDHLVFLPSGDGTLSRRARKQSALSAVVVRFSRARKRYERQGVAGERRRTGPGGSRVPG